MRGVTVSLVVRRRRLAIRIALLAVYAGLIVLLFVSGKAHVVLLDNKDTETAEAPDGVLVSVNGGEELELYRGDRDKATVQGRSMRVRLEVFADGTVVEKRLRLPLGQDMLLLSLPSLLAGSEPALVPFVPAAASAPLEEEAFSSEDLPEEELPLPGEVPPLEPPAP
jgi:hypothetical protein